MLRNLVMIGELQCFASLDVNFIVIVRVIVFTDDSVKPVELVSKQRQSVSLKAPQHD